MSLWSYGSDLSCLGRQSDVMEAAERESLTALTQMPARLLRSVASSQFVRVAAGGAHALAVTADGVLYSWGWNKYGQLGLGAANVGGSVQLPRQVAFLAGHAVGVIACGACRGRRDKIPRVAEEQHGLHCTAYRRADPSTRASA